jgi:TP901 family phage tail tape measure protein
MSGYQHMLQVKLAAEQRTAAEIAKARILASKVGIPQEQVVGAFAAYDAQARVRAAVETEFKIQRALQTAREKAEAANQAALKADLSGYQHMLQVKVASEQRTAAEITKVRQSAESANQAALKADLSGYQHMLQVKLAAEQRNAVEIAKARALASKVGIPQAEVAGAFSTYNSQVRNTEKLTTANRALSGSFKQLAVDGNDVHSMARGLASSFGLLWLTWGNLIPLFAGAGISYSLKKTFDVGSEVEYQIKFMQTLGQVSKETGEAIRAELQEIDKMSMFSLPELAKAMVQMQQAGQTAQDALAMLKPAADLAVLGQTDLETGTRVLMQTMQIFGRSSAESAKVAAELFEASKSGALTIKDLGESMKYASETSSRFGKTTSESLALLVALSKAGLKGSSGGTAMVNFLRDLSGRSGPAIQAMKDLEKSTGQVIEVFDKSGQQRAAVDIFNDITAAANKLSSADADKILSRIFSDRGGRTFYAMVRAGNVDLKELEERIRAATPEGLFKAAQGMMDTTKGAMEILKSNLVGVFDDVFVLNQEAFKNFIQDITGVISSDSFKMAVNGVVNSVKEIYNAVSSNIEIVKALGAAFLGWKAAGVVVAGLQAATLGLAGLQGAYGRLTAGMAINTGAAFTNGQAMLANAAASRATALGLDSAAVAAARATTATAALTGVSRVFAVTLGLLTGPIGWVITAATVLGSVFYATRDSAKTSSEGLTSHLNSQGQLQVEALQKVIDKARERDLLLNKAPETEVQGLYKEAVAKSEQARAAYRHTQYGTFETAEERAEAYADAGSKVMAADANAAKLRKMLDEDQAKRRKHAHEQELRRLQEQRKLEQSLRVSARPSGLPLQQTPFGKGGDKTGAYERKSNELETLKTQLGTAEAVIKQAYDREVKLLDAKHKLMEISDGEFVAKSLSAQDFADKSRIAALKAARADMVEVLAKQTKSLTDKISKLEGGTPELSNAQTELENLSRTGKTELEKLSSDIDGIKLDGFVRTQVTIGKLRKDFVDLRNESNKAADTIDRNLAGDRAVLEAKKGSTETAGPAASVNQMFNTAATEAAAKVTNDYAATLDKLRAEQEKAKISAAAFSAEIDKYAAAMHEVPAGLLDNASATNTLTESLSLQIAEVERRRAYSIDFASQLMVEKSAFDQLNQSVTALNNIKSGNYDESFKGITALIGAFEKLAQVQEELTKATIANERLNKDDPVKLAKEQARISKASTQATIAGYASMTGALKSYAREGSGTYKNLEKIQKAFHAAELAMSVQTLLVKTGILGTEVAQKVAADQVMLASDSTKSIGEIANSVAVTAVKGVQAVVNAIASMPFPLNLAAGAATAAAVVALGVSLKGGAGGGRGVPTTNKGTGTVFGNSEAQSESLSRSLDLLNDIQDEALVYSKAMAASLRSIEASMGGFTNLWLRSGGASSLTSGIATGQMDTGLSSFMNIGKNLMGPLGGALGNLVTKLFGKKVTVTGNGIVADAQNLGSIFGGGFEGSTYADVNTKRKFFGVTYSDKTRESRAGLDAGLEAQITAIFKGIGSAVGSSAELLGLDMLGVQEKLNSYVVSLGRIDLQGLDGKQIGEKLSAVFGAEADKIAQSVIPGFEALQQVGEGYFETLTRVATQFELVNTYMTRLGGTVSKVGLAGAVAADDLVKLFGGLDKFQSAVSNYYENFYTEAERSSQLGKELGSAFGRLNLTLPTTIEDYRKLVNAQDLTTESGRETYAALISLSPAFKQLSDTATEAARKIADERSSLETQLLQAQGNTAALRERERNALDESNRSLYDKIKALEDAEAAQQAYTQALESAQSALATALDRVQSAQNAVDAVRERGTSAYLQALSEVASIQEQIADEARQTANIYRDLAKQLREYVYGVIVPPKESFADALKKALAGDREAMAKLPTLATEATDSALNRARTRKEFDMEKFSILSGVLAAAAEAERLGIQTPEQEAKTLQQKLIEAQTKLAAALATANAIGAPLVAQQERLIEEYRKALAELSDARIAATRAQAALDAINGNTAQTVVMVTDLRDSTRALRSSIDINFAALDRTVDGLLTLDELRAGLAGKATDQQITAMMALLDTNNDGVISKLEASIAASNSLPNQIGLSLAGKFDTLTATTGGLLKFDQFKTQFAGLATDVELKNIFGLLDTNNDGVISKLESIRAETVKLGAIFEVGKTVTFDSNDPIRSVFDNISKTNKILTAQFTQWLHVMSGSIVTLNEQAGTISVSEVTGIMTEKNRATGAAGFPGLYVLQYDSTNYLMQIAANTSAALTYAANTSSNTSQTAGILNALAFGQYSMLVRGFGPGQTVPISFRREYSSTSYFAKGGAFTNGIVSRPTAFNIGEMGEAGSEAIMPLANIGGSLGVRAHMPDLSGMIEELRALRQEVSMLRYEARATAISTGRSEALLKRVTNNGEGMTVVTDGEPLKVVSV